MTGMSTLLRRDIFEKATGGLATLSHYIAEDYFMAKVLSDKYVFHVLTSSHECLMQICHFSI